MTAGDEGSTANAVMVRETLRLLWEADSYARTRPSVLDGKPTSTKGMRELAGQALGRLGIETVPIRMERDYNAGRTTRVPMGDVIDVRGRMRRQIRYNGFPLSYERAGPALPG
jgi:hypothetical protein